MLVAFAVRLAAVAWLSPASDVYYYLSEADRVLLSGGNPYQHLYTGIPPGLATPGAEHVFAYLPFTVVYLVPFYLAGDIRFGLIASDLIIGSCLYLYGGRWHRAAALMYLFLPFDVLFSTYYANVTLIAMAGIALFLLLESRGRGRLGAAAFGLALATVQFTLLLVPLFLVYYARRGRWEEMVIAAAVSAALIVPFLLISPSFVNETLLFQFQRPAAPLLASGGPVGFLFNPSLDAVITSLTGNGAPIYLKAAAEAILVAVLVRVTDLSNFARNSTLLVLGSVFVLPNDFFWSYLELPFVLALFWLSAPRLPAFIRRS